MAPESGLEALLQWLDGDWSVWAWGLARIAIALVAGLAAHAVLFRLLRPLVARTPWRIDDALLPRLRRPVRATLLLLALQVVLPTIPAFAPDRSSAIKHLLHLGTIAAIAWILVAVLRGVEQTTKQRYDVTAADNLEARRIHTQIGVAIRTLIVLVGVVAVGSALMTFPRVREIGTSLLASAGIVGLALGIAARPALENLIAGVQIALTQPIRIDDVVIVEGEWGRVEEITATYVVIRIWDQRRLVVPFSTFIAQPFQNWTRTNAEILGTVTLHTDYTVSVPAVRAELERLVAACEHWDGRVCVLQVTDAHASTLELRALVSAADSSRAWDLRVQVREQLIAFLQREHPGALPRARVELERQAADRGRHTRSET